MRKKPQKILNTGKSAGETRGTGNLPEKKRDTRPKTAFEVFKCSGANVCRGFVHVLRCSRKKARSVQVFGSQCLQGFDAGFEVFAGKSTKCSSVREPMFTGLL